MSESEDPKPGELEIHVYEAEPHHGELSSLRESPQERMQELRAMQTTLEALEPLTNDARFRALDWLIKVLEIPATAIPGRPVGLPPGSFPGVTATASGIAAPATPTPKEFISMKKPRTASERIACLGYYLSHFRQIHQFKSTDISELNRESASHPFGNISRDLSMADGRDGFIVHAGPGSKQMTARGEAVVDALPDREGVKAALKSNDFKKRTGGSARKSNGSTPGDDK